MSRERSQIRRLSVLAVAVGALVLAAACGGSGASSQSGAPSQLRLGEDGRLATTTFTRHARPPDSRWPPARVW